MVMVMELDLIHEHQSGPKDRSWNLVSNPVNLCKAPLEVPVKVRGQMIEVPIDSCC
jgi:hypothetical protein